MIKKVKSVRLPEHIIPERYSITLFPNLNEFTFEGVEEIVLDIKKPTKEITLHAVELEITSAAIVVNKRNIKSINIFYDENAETVTIVFDKAISGGAKLKLSFTGILNDKMRGFYRSKYLYEGKDHHMAVTQFESTDARRAIPSFDEPAKKAIFDVSLIIPEDHTAISNAVEANISEHSPGYKIVTFEPTPRMSTYLLAFIVGRFEHIESKTKSGAKVRVFVTHGKKHQAKFALETAVKCLEFYENYFGIKYPLSVLDMIAIPDFAAGAMENWGAVTYRETAILVDEELTSMGNKQHVALVIAHELAHMWFGNLVTMEWWTHLWLNEGFASYIEYIAIDKIFPAWRIWEQFVFMEHARALELDGLKNTHPIEVDVHHPAEISEIFDAVSYSKGASIIRMLAQYLGGKAFQKGLRTYLEKHQYSNASTHDLWKALEESSGKPVEKIMKNWTSKAGYPLVEVSGINKKIKLKQSRFFSNPVSAKEFKDKTVWSIPLDGKLMENKNDFISKNKFVKLNRGEASFVRIKYPLEILSSSQQFIRSKKLSPVDRYGLIRDVFTLAQSGHVSTADALALSQAYVNEDNFIVWAEIASSLGSIDNLIYKEEYYWKYREFCLNLFKKIGEEIGWEKKKNEPDNQSLLRTIVLSKLGFNGDTGVIQKAQELFERHVAGTIKLRSDLRKIVYNIVAENGGAKEYEQLLNLYENELLQEEKDRLFRALCSLEELELQRKTLDLAFSEKTRAQDRFKAISFIMASHNGKELAWEYVKKNWQSITKTFAGGHLYTRFIQPLSYFTDSKKAIEIEQFFRKKPSVGLERTIAQVTEQIRANDLWLNRDKEKISSFLQSLR